MSPTAPTPTPLRRPRLRKALEWVFLGGTGALAVLSALVFVAILVVMVQKSYPTILHYGPGFVTGSVWDPVTDVYTGAYPFIIGTLVTSGIALLLGVPISLGIAIFLSERVKGWMSTTGAAGVELLAAIPSVVYGLWAFVVLVPFMRDTIEPGLHQYLGGIPGIGPLFPADHSGSDLLTAGIILSVMLIPTVSAVARESMAQVPSAQREAALALGATHWETTRTAVLPYARTGILGAIILGLGRALGETMAVLMTVGNSDVVPTSLFSQGQSIASAIANEFTNASPKEASALIEAAVLLMGITVLVNIVARLMVRGLFRGVEVRS